MSFRVFVADTPIRRWGKPWISGRGCPWYEVCTRSAGRFRPSKPLCRSITHKARSAPGACSKGMHLTLSAFWRRHETAPPALCRRGRPTLQNLTRGGRNVCYPSLPHPSRRGCRRPTPQSCGRSPRGGGGGVGAYEPSGCCWDSHRSSSALHVEVSNSAHTAAMEERTAPGGSQAKGGET